MATEAEMREHWVCFTGHRPEKLTQPEAVIKKGLEIEIQRAIADGYTTFITGMARGVDIWAGQIVLRERAKNPQIHLICAVPHPDFEKGWKEEWQREYRCLLDSADSVHVISDRYTGPGVYMVRNKWMVDHSSRVIAVCNDQKSGTRNTMDYALKQNVDIIDLYNQ